MRRARVGFRLALFGMVMRVVVQFGGMRADDFVFGGGFVDARLRVVRVGIVMRRFLVRFVMFVVTFVVTFVGVLFTMSVAVRFVRVTFLMGVRGRGAR